MSTRGLECTQLLCCGATRNTSTLASRALSGVYAGSDCYFRKKAHKNSLGQTHNWLVLSLALAPFVCIVFSV